MRRGCGLRAGPWAARSCPAAQGPGHAVSAGRLQGSAGARRPRQLQPVPRVAAAPRGSSWQASSRLPWQACLTHAVRAPTCCAEAAQEAVTIFEAPENAAKLHEVQQQCAGDLGKFFMMMIPLATELVGSVIEKYGFEANQAGAMAFVAELQKHQGDAEIAGLVSCLPRCTLVADLPVLSRAAAPARVRARGGCEDTDAVVHRARRTS